MKQQLKSEPVRILMLEDNPADAELCEIILNKAGMALDVRRVERREDFVSALEQFKPDLVLADYFLPDLDGTEALAILRGRYPHLPYIIVSGMLDEELAVRALREGANDYLLKDRLKRLPEAVSRGLAEAKEQRELHNARLALEVSEARFRALVETSTDWIWEIDLQGIYRYCSPGVTKLLGYTPGQLVGKHICDLISREESERVGPLLASIVSRCERFFMLEWTCKHSDGHEVVLETSGGPLFDSTGSATSFSGTTRDITGRRLLESTNKEHMEQLRILFEQNADGIIVVDADGSVAAINATAAKFFGRAEKELLGLPFGMPVITGQHTEISINSKLGEETTASMMSAEIHWMGKRAFLISLQDFTEHKKRLAELDLIAHHDTLTGLPNRLLLGDRLRQAVAQNRRGRTRVAVCYLDLDGFKDVNDTFGHDAGDALLLEAAQRMQGLMRGGDSVARLGGDEFVMLLGGLHDAQECQIALERLGAEIAKPYLINGHECSGITASIGVTIFLDDNAEPDMLMRHADHAMYSAKQAGKNRYVFFDAPMEQRIEARIDTIKRVERALRDGQLLLHYQPKFDFLNGKLSGVEALIRWQHPTLGVLPPSEFLPVIEETALADEIGDWVIDQALRQLAIWKAHEFNISVSINACARQLSDSKFAARLKGTLRRHPTVSDGDLQIELVETGALKDFHKVKLVINECVKLGVSFSLDDFGTGYSTLEYLRHLPATEIKIDQSFVTNMLESKDDETIVKAVIGLGKTFQRDVVAEGAETDLHIGRLYELGCHVMQGYAIARPMAATDVIDWSRRYEEDYLTVVGDSRKTYVAVESEKEK